MTLALVHVPAGEFVMGYEEFVFRGFLLAALTAVFGFWPAAILSSLAFGAAYPAIDQLCPFYGEFTRQDEKGRWVANKPSPRR